MQAFKFALVSSNNHNDIIGTLTVHADDMKAAKKKMKADPDMEGIRFYPYMGLNTTAKLEQQAIAA